MARLEDANGQRHSSKTQQQWSELLEGTDVCFAPVLSLDEAPMHPHNVARGTFVKINGITQPAPAPRFSATPAATCHAVGKVGAETRALLSELGYDTATIKGSTD